MDYKLYVGFEEEPTLLGEAKGETFRAACESFFGLCYGQEPSGGFNPTALTLQGRHIYDDIDDARQDYIYINTAMTR